MTPRPAHGCTKTVPGYQHWNGRHYLLTYRRKFTSGKGWSEWRYVGSRVVPEKCVTKS